MNNYKITGGRPLKGAIRLHGAKNAALPILAATVLTDDSVVLRNVPTQLQDVQVMFQILGALGKDVRTQDDQVVVSGRLSSHIVPAELGTKIRYSLLFLGALLNRLGRTSVPNPGGCRIGDRKFDLHLAGLEQLGATFELGDTTILGSTKQLAGAQIALYLPTTSGTQNIILGALAAEGETFIRNANTRPENLDFARFLGSMGASLDMRNRVVSVRGGRPLHGTEYSIMNGPDELVSYMIAAAVTGGEIRIDNADLRYVPTDAKVLRDAGVDIFEWGGSVFVSARRPLSPIDIFTTPYPGINSDMQPLYSVLAATARGESTVTDMRFTDRFQYAEELRKFGIDIDVYGNCAVIQGGRPLKACDANATDLRGGAALVLAALAAAGTSTLGNTYQIERGYIGLVDALHGLGADCEVVDH